MNAVLDGPLPSPRLELRWEKTGETWFERECIYSLVMPLKELDCRREGEDGTKVRSEVKAELGRTKVTGGGGQPPIYEDGVDTPYRDGAHAQWDSAALGGVPVIAVCGEYWSRIDGTPRFLRSNSVQTESSSKGAE